MAKRRSDTRERIQETALQLFAERGYEQTSLREIAERLGVTKAALYYHFTTKEEIVAGLIDAVAESIDDLAAWAATRPATAETRETVLRRVAALAQGRWRPLVRFAQENQPALRRLGVGADIRERAHRLFSLFDDPGADLAARVRGRLAVGAVVMGSLHGPEDLGAGEEEVRAATLAVALELVAPRQAQPEGASAAEPPPTDRRPSAARGAAVPTARA